jgi:hypothetical protein
MLPMAGLRAALHRAMEESQLPSEPYARISVEERLLPPFTIAQFGERHLEQQQLAAPSGIVD